MTFQELHNDLKARCKKAAAEGRPFEELFSAFQSEMIRQSIALAENRAEKIYIYSDFEEGMFTAKPLFRIRGEYYTENDMNKAVKVGKMVSALSKPEKSDIGWTIMAYAVAVRWLCRDYKRAIPTVIKIVYDAKTRQVRAQYGYERLKPLSDCETEIRCRMWFDEIRANNL